MTTEKQIDFNLLEANSICGLTDQEIDQIAGFQEFDLIDPEIDLMLNDCCSSLSKSDANSKSENIVTTIQANCRFQQMVSDADIENRKLASVPKGTQLRNKWALNVFNEWKLWRNINITFDLSKWEEQDLVQWLPKFIHEVRKKDGTLFPNNSLYSIIAGLQNHINTNNSDKPKVNFFSDVKYRKITESLDTAMKISSKEGVGIHKKQAQVITLEEETELWEKGQLGSDTPKQIINTLFYYNGLHFAVRGGDEHRNLKMEQFHIESNPGGLRKLVYKENVTKTFSGGLKHRRIEANVKEHHENITCPEKCHVRIYEKYLSMRPPNSDHSFYLKPLTNGFSGKMVLGINTLKTMLKNMFKEAGMACSGKTNHSLKATCATRLFNSGVDEQIIMTKTGHRTVQGVRSYKRISHEQMEQASVLIDGRSIQQSKNESAQVIFNINAQNVTINNSSK